MKHPQNSIHRNPIKSSNIPLKKKKSIKIHAYPSKSQITPMVSGENLSIFVLLTCDQCAQGDSLGRWGQLKGHRLMQGVVAEIEGACAAQQGLKKGFI